MAGRPLTDEEFGAALSDFERSAFRLELQPAYFEDYETATVDAYLNGHPEEPSGVDWYAGWLGWVRERVAAGKTIERVRVYDVPLTPYQRWLHWAGGWNIGAGERIAYLSRPEARRIGLLPTVDGADWWLLDDQWLIVTRYHPDGRRRSAELTDDENAVRQACEWRDLAVHHSTPGVARSAAA